MKAVQIRRFGGPEVLETVDVPPPQPASGQVLVCLRAVGVNLAEALMRQDRYAVTPPLPAILGSEAAGEVAGWGPGVTGFAIGQRVAAPLFVTQPGLGAYAEYAVIDAGLAVPIPDALPFEQATALMIQGLTALHLTRQAPPEGRTVLVNAAAGGVGSLLVQLARRAGARRVIAGASSAAKIAFAQGLGAAGGVNYTEPGWEAGLRDVLDGAGPEIVYESVGGAVTMASLAALAPLGRLVIYGALNIQSFNLGVPELLGLIFRNQSVTGFALAPLLTPERLQTDLAELFRLAVRGDLRVTIGGTYSLDRAADAHRALEGRATTGKLVLLP